MNRSKSKLNLQPFYPDDSMKILELQNDAEKVTIKIKSISTRATCYHCNCETSHYHGTYKRRVQDLPILGKTVYLDIIAHEYKCENELCDASTFVEDFNGFLSYYGRMTERCADFVCTLAMETNCEGSARICNAMNLKTSGDSIIRLLTKRFNQQSALTCSDVIGVDDFSFKKRHIYGTIIVDGETHNTIAVLEGRNGDSLKEWLQKNKHIKTVTRDRASAYAKVISEVLPDAIQIADRFHLHQNLLEVITKVLGREIPATIAIPKESKPPSNADNNAEITGDCVTEPTDGKKNRTECG